MNTIVKLKKLTPNAIIPTYGTAQSAGADLYSGMEQPVTIEPGKTEFIHTGIAIAIPEGPVELTFATDSVTLSWRDDNNTAGLTALPRDQYELYVADGKIVL